MYAKFGAKFWCPKWDLDSPQFDDFLRNWGVAKSPFLFVWIFREAVYLNIPILVYFFSVFAIRSIKVNSCIPPSG